MAEMTLCIGNKNYSSWSLRAWLVLKATTVAFEEVVIPLDQPTTRETILKYSPSGRLPVLKARRPVRVGEPGDRRISR